MSFKEKDFIEIEFTGKVKGGEIFDSNIQHELEKTNFKGSPKPFIYSLGQGMFLQSIDKFLIGKELGEYTIQLKPEEAFGKRDPKLIQMIPIKHFIEHRLNPIPGSIFNFDGKLAKVLTVSGGRVMVDFNNPLSGKDVEYYIKVLRKVDNQEEKVRSLNDFFFRQEFKYEIKENKLIMDVPKGMKIFIEMFKDKYKDLLDLDVLANEVETKKE